MMISFKLVIPASNPVIALRKDKARVFSLSMYNSHSHYQSIVI